MKVKDIFQKTTDQLRKNWLPYSLIFAVLIGSLLYPQGDDQPIDNTEPDRQAVIPSESDPYTVPTAITIAPISPADAIQSTGEQYPYADMLFYPYAGKLIEGFSPQNCFTIPPGGTAWAGIVLGGPDNTTRFDTSLAAVTVVDIYGSTLWSEIFDPRVPPEKYPARVSSVPAGFTTTCAQ